MYNSLISYLGKPIKERGSEKIWRCPICASYGADTAGDNLKYNSQKNLLACFADVSHSHQILKDIKKADGGTFKLKEKDRRERKVRKVLTKEEIDRNVTYMLACNDNLMNDNDSLNFLYRKRGINPYTASFCGIGIDKKKKAWVFPMFVYKGGLESFEFRPPNLSSKGIWKQAPMPYSFCEINNKSVNTEILIIVEGFIDGYVLWQHLDEKDQSHRYHILTPSNGVSGVFNLMPTLCLNEYKKTYLYLDSDPFKWDERLQRNVSAGIDMMNKVKEKYPFIEIRVMDCGCKDFNEHYLRCLKGKKG